MTEQDAVRAYLNSNLRRKFPEPSLVVAARVSKSVIIRDLSEIVVARIGVTALAIRESVSDRVVVISLNARHSCFTRNLTCSISEWTECTEISKAVKALDSACSCVPEESFEGEIIAVNTPEKADAVRGVLRLENRVLCFGRHKASINYVRPGLDNLILSRFTAAAEAFEQRAPYW